MADQKTIDALIELLDGEEANYCGPGYGTCGSIAIAPQAARDLAAAIAEALPGLGWIRVPDAKTEEEWNVRLRDGGLDFPWPGTSEARAREIAMLSPGFRTAIRRTVITGKWEEASDG